MRIAFLTELFPYYQNKKLICPAGGEARYYFLAKNLSKNYEIEILTTKPNRNYPSFEKINGIKINRLSLRRNPGIDSLIFALKALKYLKNNEFDLIDANQFLPHLVNYFSKNKAKKVNTIHDIYLAYDKFRGINFWIKNNGLIGLGGWFIENLELFFDRYIEKIVVVSEWTKQKALKFGIPKEKIVLVSNGIDFEKINSIQSFKQRDKIICIGRFIKYKNQLHAVKAFNEILKSNENLTLNFVYSGSIGNYETILKNEVKKLNLEKKVFFHKAISEEQKFKLLKESLLMLFPSICEGQGIAILEALACGTPVVAYNLPAYKGMIENAKNGFIVEKNNILALVEASKKVLENQKRFSINAKAKAKEFDWKKITKLYEKKIINN